MFLVGFEPTITASEWAKRVHALDHSPTMTGRRDNFTLPFNICLQPKMMLWSSHNTRYTNWAFSLFPQSYQENGMTVP
jgi:hypothetical protein